MDEQTTPTEPTTTAPDPVANTTTTLPPQPESPQPHAEPVPAPETTQTEPVIEPTEALPEPPTPQMGRNEPLPETAPEPTPQGAIVPEVTAPTPPQTQQGAVQPEPTPTPVPETVPAQGPQEPLPFSKTDDRQENLVAPVITTPPQNIVGLILTKARAVIQLRKQKKLIKIMGLFAKQTSITNDEVEKLLHVSDATATRYLSELEKQGKITQTGKTGHAVTYTKR